MKRRDLEKKINAIAKDLGVEAVYEEGANHTKVTVGDKKTTLPRHNEVNEHTARGILRYLEGDN